MSAAPRERATLLDVARASGVSRQTVSNVLNNPHRVAPGTLQRVSADIERLGFRPNRAARSLRRRRANALGIQVQSAPTRAFGTIFDPFLAALTSAAQDSDSHLITFVAEDDQDVLATYERLLATQVVDGFVLTDTRRGDPRPGWLGDRGVPFVSFGRIWDDPSVTSWVDVDGRAATCDGVRHLRAQGYRRVAYLGWPEGSPVGDNRRQGWLEATTELGQDCARFLGTCSQDVMRAREAAGPLLAGLDPGDAVLCVSDSVALGVLLALGQCGRAAGSDIGVLGFDDCDFAPVFGLSSIRQPLDAIARELIHKLADDRAQDHGSVVSPTVVQRSSTTRGPATR